MAVGERDRSVEDELCEALKSFRLNALARTRHRGWDQASVARRASCHATSVFQWENGICYPGTLAAWKRWADSLGLELVVELREKPRGI